MIDELIYGIKAAFYVGVIIFFGTVLMGGFTGLAMLTLKFFAEVLL